MDSSREYYRRNLPHYQPSGYAFFVTFRLYGTLPVEMVENFRAIKKKKLALIAGYDNLKVRNEKYEEFRFEYFKLFDDYLDKCNEGYQWLNPGKAGDIVKEAIHYRDGKEYDLISYTIMPNHVHIVFIPTVMRFAESLAPVERFAESLTPVERLSESLPNGNKRNSVSLYKVTKILQDLKKYTAVNCNKVLTRSGAFWQHESYDHVIKDSDELKRIVNYVLNNPVKAGLAASTEEWMYNYVNYELIPVL